MKDAIMKKDCVASVDYSAALGKYHLTSEDAYSRFRQ
ncbi:hypothetical protein SHPE106448_15315 [Shewanella pealeana]